MDIVIYFPRAIAKRCNMDISLSGIKLLAVILSKANLFGKRVEYIELTKKEAEKVLGVGKVNLSSLERIIKELSNISVFSTENSDFSRNIFSCVETSKNQKERTIELYTSDYGAIRIFNIKKSGYFSINLEAITTLKSKHSVFMLLYLAQNAFRKEWTISVDKLKKWLKIGDDKYTNMRDFNKYVLKSSLSELTTALGIRYEYSLIHCGRTVTGIKFSFLGDEKKDFTAPPALKNRKKADEAAEMEDIAFDETSETVENTEVSIDSSDSSEVNDSDDEELPVKIVIKFPKADVNDTNVGYYDVFDDFSDVFLE